MSTNGENETLTTETKWAPLVDRLNPNREVFDAALKKEWENMTKVERKQMLREDQNKIKTIKARGKQPLPFDTVEDDHCETSSTAFAHIVPFLVLLAKKLKKQPNELVIYDPYYCAGSIVQHLNRLGFPRVHNVPEDFYEVISNKTIPEHDVVLTNPPYSGNHFERLLDFLKSNGKPFLLLLPSHFSKRPAFQEATSLQKEMVYLTPKERYHYWTPLGRRPSEDKKRKHRNIHLGSRNSPFVSHWFISLAPIVSRKKILKLGKKMEGGLELSEGCVLHGEVVHSKGTEQAFNPANETDDSKRHVHKLQRCL